MLTYVRKSLPKNKIALISAIILSIIMLCFVTKSWSSTPIDGILQPVHTKAYEFADVAFNAVLKSITDPFSPQLESYNVLYDGSAGAWGRATVSNEFDKSTDRFKGNPIINWIVTFSQRFGAITATILVLVFLLLCMVGRSEQIHDSPVSLMIKYAVVMLVIYMSWDIVFYVISLSRDIWTNFVMTSWEGASSLTPSAATLTTDDPGAIDEKARKIRDAANIITIVAKDTSDILWATFNSIFGIFMMWKLFKNFLKLVLEIAERYFVFTILLFMCPAVLPACVSNATSSIFQAYVRMIISQTFLILTNGLFVKIFTLILLRGGWTSSLTGYIMSFAYVRFCTRIDMYLLTIGMNAAQTGGGFLESMGGAAQTISAAMRTGSQIGDMRHNIGTSTMNKALASGDKAGYERGVKMATPLTPFSKHAGKEIPSFEQAMQARGGMPGDRIPEYSQRRQGEKYNVSEMGSMSSITDAAGRAGLSSNQANEFVNRLESAGIKRDSIAGFKQVDGTKEFSETAGKIQAAYDKNGFVLGYHSSASGGDNYYVSDTQADELEKYKNNQIEPAYLSRNNESDVKSVLGDDVIASSITRSSNEELGSQRYRYKKHGDSNVYQAEVSSASFHLDKAGEKGYTMRSNTSGRDFLVKESVVKNP